MKIIRIAAFVVSVLTLSVAASAQKPSQDKWVSAPMAPQYFAVVVGDMDRSVAWYKTAFGLRELDDQKDPNGVWRIVNLASETLFVELIWDSRKTESKSGRGLFKVGFAVPDVGEVAKNAEAATGEKLRIVDSAKHKIRIVQLRDPDGNILQFTSPLAAAESN